MHPGTYITGRMGAAERTCVVAARNRITNAYSHTRANGDAHANSCTYSDSGRHRRMLSNMGVKPGLRCRK